ncbi:uncharacterized protein LOC129578138 isoform X1 [Sitodiplosis mosellana]|uniref:uncharacterized protein LOC129578138 isoform X1 n=1 Tax=Sitodiplosis mosellana TaxID=263140 RepID=UPI002444E570|nr:uncharacterized protein LOC129578138 isoform X1 [Sitodiplosis mosellana]
MRLSIWIPGILGILGPIVIPISHMVVLWFYWQNYARFVDRRFCSCSCWDTVFKGTYESGIASYKHLYFNATENTMKIWILTVIAIIALYECAKHLISLMILKSVRYSMIFLFCLSIFSHYYGWWAFLNYYNDDFYSQWNHQMFFTITELLSTSVVFHLANLENIVTPRKVLSVVGIAILHIVASGFDQFIANVFKGEGLLHQVHINLNGIRFYLQNFYNINQQIYMPFTFPITPYKTLETLSTSPMHTNIILTCTHTDIHTKHTYTIQ